MSRINRFAVRFFMFTLILFAVIAVGVNRYRSQAQIGGIPTVTVVSAATFEDGPLAPDSIAVIFGQFLSSGTASATTTPLPTTLLGTSVQITDSRNAKHGCGLFFVSPGQINFLIPAAAAPGAATVTITTSGIFPITITANIQIAAVAPGLFSANSSGQGAATGFLLAVPQSGGQSYEPLAEFNPVLKRFQSRPVLILRQTVQAERLFFVFYGTGIRGRTNLNNVTAVIGGYTVPVSYAGPAGNLLGLDQINIEIDNFLKRTLTGRGKTSVILNVAIPGGASISNQIEIDLAGQSNPVVQITGFTPQRALAGETVTINGDNFSAFPPRNFVRIGGLNAQVTEASETQLKVKVPFGAETGRITVGTGSFDTTSRDPLTIRTSISGFVEDTRRRPVIGVKVSIVSTSFGSTSIFPTTKTNSEGVFVLPDVPTDEAVYLEIDASAASVTPRLPKLLLSPVIAAGRDSALPRPVTLQIPTGTALRVPITNISLTGGLRSGSPETLSLDIPTFLPSFDLDWPIGNQASSIVGTEADALAQQVCTPPIRPITFTLPDRVTVFAPCYTTEECLEQGILLYASQIENNRSPVRLPVGHYSSTMVQISPFESIISPGGELAFANTDCLPTNSAARIFQLTGSGLRASVGIGGIPATVGQFVDRGPANISADGQRVTMGNDIVDGGGIYFVSVKRPTATIIGRVQETVFFSPGGASPDNVPASGAIVTARGQEAVTDNNGAFILRNVPVLRTGDRVSLDISLLRPNGRVERGLITDIAITGNSVTSLNPFTLTTPVTNRPPVILASAAVSADENKLRDFNFSVSDADPNQTLQVRMTGPSFASLINRGGGAYTLRLMPGFADSGNYSVTFIAVDSLGAVATHSVALTVNNVNQPPTATAQTVAAEEDTSKKITLTGADGDRDALAFVVVAKPTHGKLTGNAPDLTYTPDANYFGADSFTFKVNDGLADSAAATVPIAITPVNDAPRLAVPVDQKVAAGATLNFAVSATEVDPTDSVMLSAADLPTGATFNQVTTSVGFAAQFSWTPTASQIGTFVVAFKAADSGIPSLSETRSVAITVTAAGAPASAGIWTPTSGPTGGSVQTLFVSGSTVLASTTNGVFRSTNGGDTWSPVSNIGLIGLSLTFANIGNTIFAASAFGVYRSGDNGATWIESSQGLPRFSSIGGFVAKGSSLFVEISNVIYVSADNGQNWNRAGTVPRENFSSVGVLAVGGRNLFAAVNAFGSSNKLYRSADDGQTWTPVVNGLPENPFSQITQIVANGNTLYAVLSEEGIYRSFNDGQNWASVPLSLGIISIRAIHFTPDQLLLGANDRLYAVARTGDMLETTVRATLDNQDVLALASIGDVVFAGTLANGVFRSTDKALTWKQANAGLTGIAVAAFLPVNASLFAATSLGIYVTEDQGRTWQPMNNGLPAIINSGGFLLSSGYSLLASVNVSGTTYLFTGQESGGVYRSSDLGKSWQTITSLPSRAEPFALGVSGSTIFASISSGFLIPGQSPTATVYRSDDLGQTWTPAGNGLSLVPNAFASIGSNLFAATQEGVFVTSNRGDSWSAANGQGATGLPEKTAISALVASGSNLYAGTAQRGIYVSTNNGQSWTAINTYLPEKPTVTAIAASGSNLFIVASGVIIGRLEPGSLPRSYAFAQGTVYFSPNQGRSWALVTSGLGETLSTALGLNGTNVFAGTTGRGVFSRQF